MTAFRRGQIVLVDTNVIIEAHRTKCWSSIAGWFRIETVGKCVEEAGTGGLHDPGYVTVDIAALRAAVTVHSDDALRVAAAALRYPDLGGLDAGERELLAFAAQYDADWRAASPDKACLRVAYEMGLPDRFISLEEMVRAAGADARSQKRQYTEKWLRRLRTQLLLGPA